MRRHWPFLLPVVLLALTALDARRPPTRQVGTRAALAVIDGWQAVSTHGTGQGGCRFTPTCSVYGELAIRRYGAYRGGWLALRRIWRCNPWNELIGEDWLR